MNFIKTLISLCCLMGGLTNPAQANQQISPLFASDDPMRIVLEMDMAQVLNDAGDDPQYRHAQLIHMMPDNKIHTFSIKIKARGQTRRIKQVCEFPPLKLNFDKDATDNSIFEGQNKLKMVTHCRNNDEFENFAVLEYLAYKTFNQITDMSYRVRMVEVTYRDTQQNYPDMVKSGFIIEDDDLMAERLGGKISEKKIWSPDSCLQESVDLFSLFQFMIGNTDWWIHRRHNVDLVELADGSLVPIPFDFDYAGIINTPYAIPSPSMPIKSVEDRFFKGTCKSATSYTEALHTIVKQREEILAVFENTALLDKKFKRRAVRYMENSLYILSDSARFAEVIDATCQYIHEVQGLSTIK
jgi:hypothetical protein